MMVETWLKTGLLVSASYHDPEQRRVRVGVVVDNRRRPTVLEPFEEAP